jgi:hypothetical protein
MSKEKENIPIEPLSKHVVFDLKKSLYLESENKLKV